MTRVSAGPLEKRQVAVITTVRLFLGLGIWKVWSREAQEEHRETGFTYLRNVPLCLMALVAVGATVVGGIVELLR